MHWTTVGGLLINDGDDEDESSLAQAPVSLEEYGAYAVESEIKWIRSGGPELGGSFGIVVRYANGAGYWVGFHEYNGFFCPAMAFVMAGDATITGCSSIAVPDELIALNEMDLDTNEWHTYRVEVVTTTITLSIDNRQVLSVEDNQFTSGGAVGLFSYRMQVSIRQFSVDPIDGQ